jgi:glutathione S-transferase
MEDHLARNTWFAGEALSIADFQMSFAVEAALTRGTDTTPYPHVRAWRERMNARPAYQRALQRGGPVIANL